MLRTYLQDSKLKNVLTGKMENIDEELLFFIRLAIDDYNLTPPPITVVNIETYPSMSLLIHGAIIQLFLSNGILQTRNQLSYQDGGGALQLYEKGPQYINNATVFAQLYEQKKNQFKTMINIAGGWGTITPINDYNLLMFPYDDE